MRPHPLQLEPCDIANAKGVAACLPVPHKDIETSPALVTERGEWLDPAAPLPAGSSVQLVCGLANKGDRRINVTGVTALLSDRYNNMRTIKVLRDEKIERGAVIDPAAPDGDVGAGEVSVAFPFRVPDEAELRALGTGFTGFPFKVRLSAAVYYDEVSSRPFASAFFNETITISAPSASLFTAANYAALLPTICGLAAFAGLLTMLFDAVPAFSESSGGKSLGSWIWKALTAFWTAAATEAAAAAGSDKAKAAAAPARAAADSGDDDDSADVATPSIIAGAGARKRAVA